MGKRLTMDIFMEYLMQKKPSRSDGFKKLGLACGTLLACYIVMILFSMIGSFMNAYMLPGMAAVIYGAIVLNRNFNVEYEYIFTNGELDVDLIKAKKIRKRLAGFPCARIELMASAENDQFLPEFESDSVSQRFQAVYDPKAGGIYHVLYTRDGEKLLLTFQPPAKLLSAMKQYNPRCIHIKPGDGEPLEAE